LAGEYDPTQIAPLVWHVGSGDPFATSETWARFYYYNLVYTPTFMLDGWDQYVGTSYYTVKSKLDNHLLDPSSVSIDVAGVIDDTDGEVTVDVTALYTISQLNLKVRIVLYESRIYWGGRWFDHTVRDVLPEQSITLSQPGDHVQVQRSFTLQPTWVAENMGIVAFVQSDVDKRILQAANLTEATVSLTPHALSFPRGSTMGYSALLMSNMDGPQTVVAYGEVWLPNGNPYPGNPVKGPVNVPLSAFQMRQMHLGHHIPMGAPLGDYIYKVTLETLGGDVIDNDEFVFTVTE